MTLKSIEITNFRCFDHLKVDLQPGLNVFVGVNGSGKTALLEAIRAGLGAFFTGFEYEDVEQFYLSEKDVRVEYRGVTKIEYRPVIVKCIADVDDYPDISWVREFNKKTTSNKEHIGSIRGIAKRMALDMHNPMHYPHPVAFPTLFYFSTQRLWVERKDFGSKADGNRFGGYFNSLNAKSASHFFADWFERQERHEFQNAQMGLGKDFSQLELVRQIAVKCIPDCRRIYFDALAEDLFLQFDNQNMPISLLSDGQKTLLLLCTGIALQCVLLNPHLGLEAAKKAKGVVLIDEVDLHLHPAWQRRVLNDLMKVFPEIQFIVTTHSPQVISRVPKQNVFILREFKVESGRVFTEGRDSNSILYEVFGEEKRPIDFKEQLDEFYELLENEKEQMAAAILKKLEAKWGHNDSEIVTASLYLNDLKNEIA